MVNCLISASKPVLQGLPRRVPEDVEKRSEQEVDDERRNVLLQLKTKNKKQKINFGLQFFSHPPIRKKMFKISHFL